MFIFLDSTAILSQSVKQDHSEVGWVIGWLVEERVAQPKMQLASLVLMNYCMALHIGSNFWQTSQKSAVIYRPDRWVTCCNRITINTEAIGVLNILCQLSSLLAYKHPHGRKILTPKAFPVTYIMNCKQLEPDWTILEWRYVPVVIYWNKLKSAVSQKRKRRKSRHWIEYAAELTCDRHFNVSWRGTIHASDTMISTD